MRLLITGKTQSGKTTALHRFLLHALRLSCWNNIYLFDGKGHLNPYAELETVTYAGPHQLEIWAAILPVLAAALPDRIEALLQQKLYTAPDSDKRTLIVIDEVQKGTRAKTIGKPIKDAISLLSEQSAALGDVLVLSSQREVNAIPPDARANANARLLMLGKGYFYYQTDGQPTCSGRVAFIDSDQVQAQLAAPTSPISDLLSPDQLPTILGRQEIEPTHAPATLYLGTPGAGKTYALEHHPKHQTTRTIYLDLAQPHRVTLTKAIEEAGATVPPQVRIPDLAEIAGLAIQSEPTLLQLDNLHQMSEKVGPSLTRMMNAAAEVAMAANEPRTSRERERVNPYLTRCAVKELPPIPPETAKALLWGILDRNRIKHPRAVEKKVLADADGKPGNVVRLAQRIQRGDQPELRDIHSPVRVINIGWVLILILIAFAMVARWQVDSYVVAGFLFAISIVLRPIMYRMIRHNQ